MTAIGLLRGTRVLDLGSEALAYAGRVLAELGAEVILVEPPGGSPLRRVPPLVEGEDGTAVSAGFLAYAAGKRSVTIDEGCPDGRSRRDLLVASADIVLLGDPAGSGGPDLDERALRLVNDDLIAVSATGFGRTGVHRNWRGSDTVAWASSGLTFPLGDPDRPPVVAPLGLTNAVSSLNACMGALLALRARRARGSGQAVDISMQEAALSVSMEAGPQMAVEGLVPGRVPRARLAGLGVISGPNGTTVDIAAFLPGQWDSLAAWIAEILGMEEPLLDVFRGPVSVRAPYIEIINGWIAELLGHYTKHEFFLEAQRRGIPCGPVNGLVELLDDEHLRAAGAWEVHSVPGLPPFRLPRGPLSVDGVRSGPSSIPAVGEHNDVVLGSLG